jgi:hypothetical protein
MGICENERYLILLLQLNCKYDKYILNQIRKYLINRTFPPPGESQNLLWL